MSERKPIELGIDAMITNYLRLEKELAAALSQREAAREWVRATLGSAHLKEMDDYIKEECGK